MQLILLKMSFLFLRNDFHQFCIFDHIEYEYQSKISKNTKANHPQINRKDTNIKHCWRKYFVFGHWSILHINNYILCKHAIKNIKCICNATQINWQHATNYQLKEKNSFIVYEQTNNFDLYLNENRFKLRTTVTIYQRNWLELI